MSGHRELTQAVMPLRPPPMTRAAAAGARRRAAPRAVLDLAAGTTLRLAPAGDDDDAAADLGVRLTYGTQALDVRVPWRLIEARVRGLDKALDPSTMPDDLVALLLETALRDDLDRLEEICGCPVAIDTVGHNIATKAVTALRLLLEQHGCRWPVHVSAPASRLLETLVRRWPRAARPMSRFPLPAVLRLGTTALPYAVLASLRPGDAVLLQFADATGARLVVAEGLLAATRKDETGWVLTEPPRQPCHPEKSEWTMQHDSEIARPETIVTDADELPIQLAFDIGQVPMTLGALRGLGVGAVVELNRDARELVRISAHGALVGQGELVEVDGRLAVRIVRLFDHG